MPRETYPGRTRKDQPRKSMIRTTKQPKPSSWTGREKRARYITYCLDGQPKFTALGSSFEVCVQRTLQWQGHIVEIRSLGGRRSRSRLISCTAGFPPYKAIVLRFYQRSRSPMRCRDRIYGLGRCNITAEPRSYHLHHHYSRGSRYHSRGCRRKHGTSQIRRAG